MIIQGSILGALADLNQWSRFSCLNPDGSLNSKKYSQYVRYFANRGANSIRELPFLVTDLHYKGQGMQWNFLPFQFNQSLGKYNLDVHNPLYFDNLREMVKIANRHNLVFQFSIFDRCHSASLPKSPWNLNQQGIKGYYHWNDYTRRYVLKIIETVKQAKQEMWTQESIVCHVWFELENEPMDDAFVQTSIETLKLLLSNGVKKEEIEDGVPYLPIDSGMPVIRFNAREELERNRLFELLKKAKRNAGLYPGEDGQDKARYFSTIHRFAVNTRVLQELQTALGHTRRFSLSCDGEKPKPDADLWRDRLLPLFNSARWRPQRTKRLENWKIEHVYRGDLEGNSDFGDAMDGVLGISKAYYQVFGQWPENYEKFLKVIEGPQPPGPTEPPSLQEQIDQLKQQVEQNRLDIASLKKES